MMRHLEPDEISQRVAQLPRWNALLRSLREASGVTQEGWAAYLGYGRRTLQRWERGESVPDAAATEEIVRLIGERGLFRSFHNGPLNGLTITADAIRDVLAEARPGQGRQPMGKTLAAPGLNKVLHLSQPSDRAHNIPREITSFVGREALIDDVVRRVETSPLVTLTGPGGVGKTRLALRTAAKLVDRFPDGVWLVRLDALRDPSLVAREVATVLGIREKLGTPLERTLDDVLRDRQMLVVLDSCEHVLESSASLVVRLLGSCSGVRFLTTSRELLSVFGEVVVRVPPLSVPRDVANDSDHRVPDSESAKLFVERARAANPEFQITGQNEGDVASICQRLDGIPLSIELAAAWTGVLTPAEIDRRLEDRFRFLRGARSLTPRHQTLHAAIEWSYNLLSPAEQQLFDQLSIFSGAFALDAAESVCTLDPPEETLALLARLVETSMVMSAPLPDGRATRYRMLDTLRAFAGQRLRERGTREIIERRLALWICSRAEIVPDAIHSPDQRRWFAWISANDANIRSAMNWAVARGESELVLRIITGLWWSLGVLGRQLEVREWLERAIAMPASDELDVQKLRAMASSHLGTVSVLQGDIDSAREILSGALNLASTCQDESATLAAHAGMALIAVSSGMAEADCCVEETLKLARRLGSVWTEARLLEMHAQLAVRRGDHESAKASLERGIALARGAGDIWGLAQLLGNFGDVARSSGQHARAAELYEESQELRATLGIPGIAPNVRHNLGYVALAERQASGVREQFFSALRDFERSGDLRGIAECLIGIAGVEAVAGDPSKAATLFGAAESALAAIGAQIWPSNLADYDRLVSVARSRCAPENFDAARSRGRLLSLEQAIALAAQPDGRSRQS